MSKILKAIIQNKTEIDHKTFLGLILDKDSGFNSSSSNISLSLYNLANETTSFYNQPYNMPKPTRTGNQMNSLTKFFYIFSLLFIFTIGLIGILIRLADRDDERTIYLAYKKYHRSGSEKSLNAK